MFTKTITRTSLLAMAIAAIAITSIFTAAPRPALADQEQAPTGLTLTATDANTIEAAWNAHPDNPVDYRIKWRRAGESYRGRSNTEWNAYPTANSYTITGLDPDTTYEARVTARFNTGPNSNWSNDANATTPEAATPTPEPTPEPTPAPTPEPGIDYDQERTGSVSLGDITDAAAQNRDETVHAADPVDYFHFSLTHQRNVGLRIRSLDYNADLYVEDNDGTVLASSENAGDQREVLNLSLAATAAGEHYYVRVEAREDDRNDYQFRYFAETPPNAAATGAATISGTAQVRETLTADTSAIADDNGLSNAAFTHQWVRTKDGTDTDISGATRSAFLLTHDELDHTVTVRVSFTDDAGYQETVTSVATATVVRPPNVSPSGLPTISGSVGVGKTISTDTSGISDGNGLSNPNFTYRWVSVIDDADTDISGATGASYDITASDAGSAFKVTVGFTDDDGYSESLTSAATAVLPEQNDIQPRGEGDASGQPTITGALQLGETLSADTTGITDSDGLTNVEYAYQWIRNNGNADADIAGATGATYTLTTDDLAHAIKVTVTFTDDGGHLETLTSDATTPVNRPPNATAAGQPTITGTMEVGETLAASTSGITDLNGLSNAQYTYQWVRPVDGTDTDISGATGSSYTITSSDSGTAIKVTVTFTDDDGYTETLTSAARTVLAVAQQHNDDFAGGINTTGVLQVGGSVNGNIHNAANNPDDDWFKVESLTTGWYNFSVTGRGSNPLDTSTIIIRDNDGDPIRLGGRNFIFTASGNGSMAGTPRTIYVAVTGSNGNYTLSAERRYYWEPESADLPAGTNTAGWVQIDRDPYPWTSGNIRSSADEDWFWVDLEAGQNYRIDVTGSEANDNGGSLSDPWVRLLDSSGSVISNGNAVEPLNTAIDSTDGIADDNSGEGNNAQIDIAVQTGGPYIVAVKRINGNTGSYTVKVNRLSYPARGTRTTVSETSGGDLPSTASTTGYVQVNGDQATGNIESSTDFDHFAVRLEAGHSYRIDVWGDNSPAHGGTMADPEINIWGEDGSTKLDPSRVEQLNATGSGQLIGGIYDTDSGVGTNAQVDVKVHITGTYYLSIRGGLNSAGTYTVFVKDEGQAFSANPRGSEQSVSEGNGQDLPDFLTSTGYVQVNGDGATGNIAPGNDHDVFAIKLSRFTQYQIDVWGDDSDEDGGSLSDPQVRLLNPSFDNLTNARFVEQIPFLDWEQFRNGGIFDTDGGSGINARVRIAPHVSEATYYIQVSSADRGTGTYTVLVRETSKHHRQVPNGLRPGLPSGHSYLPTFSEPKGEDLPGTPSTAATTKGRVEPVGTRAHGDISSNGDTDMYKAYMVAGYRYRIDVKGAASSALGGTLSNPVVQMATDDGDVRKDATLAYMTLGDSNNDFIGDNNSGSGNNARFEINVLESGEYYLAVGQQGDNATGTYTVQSKLLGPGPLFRPQGTDSTVSEPPGGDLSDNRSATIGFIQPDGDPATGNIDPVGDVDAFKFKTLTGATYRIDVKGSWNSDTGDTLADPSVLLIGPSGVKLDSDNTFINLITGSYTSEGTVDNNSGAGNNARIEFKNLLIGEDTFYPQSTERMSEAAC